MPLTLNMEASSDCSASFVSSLSQEHSKHLDLAKESTTSVAVVFKKDTIPAFNFHYLLVHFHEFLSKAVNMTLPNLQPLFLSFSDKSPVFESPLLLPWETITSRLDIVLQPWLLITNRSGITLEVFTASSLEDINAPDDSAVSLDANSSLTPGAGEVI